MRTPATFLLLLVVASSPALAAHSITVAQLDQQLTVLRAKPDAEAAYLIADLQLTERLSAAHFAQLKNRLPGDKSQQALLALADQSAFLPPPAAELPSTPVPDLAEQKRIMGLVVGYVAKTIPQLPNFVATRATTRYEDTPLVQEAEGGFIPYEPLHAVGAENTDVVYDNGRETARQRVKSPAPEGLTTWGVFGPILSTVLLDAARSNLAFARWEREPDGPRAVFSYAVTREKSHYEVNFCCVAKQAATVAATVYPFKKSAAYHGEIAVDPATGDIRRLLLQADLKGDDPVTKADILVEYGPVEIGGRTYICPVHSVSRSLAQTVQVNQRYHYALANQIQPLKNSLNDVRFVDYHIFRGDTRMLAEVEPPSPGSARPESSSTPEQTTAMSEQPATAKGEVAASANVAPPPATATAAGVAGNEPSAAIAAPRDKPAPEISESANASFADLAASPQSQDSSFTLHSTSRLVDVAVVAFDKKGRPVTDLKPEDLQIFDNGRPQQVKYVSHAGDGALLGSPTLGQGAQNGEPVFTNRTATASVATFGETSANSTVLMIDAANLAFSDFTYARGEMLRFLKSLPAGEHVGLYILGSHGFQVVLEPTEDHARLASTLAAWMPSAQDLARAQDEERRNRQQFDWVHSVSDLAYVNGNGQGGNDPEMYTAGNGQMMASGLTILPPDAELRPLGNRPEDFVLHLLVGVGRHLAVIPGHKTLVWISSDNVFADWSAQAVGREDTGNTFLDGPAMRARETLNEAHVSIYPLDVSQLEVGGIGADIGNRNVTVIGKTSRDPSTAAAGNAASGNSNGRDTARMQEDTHPIQGAFRDLAAATGGRALRRAGDIAHELDTIVADGRAAWLLSFTPDTPADGKYHVLTVKTDRRGVTLRFRTGYVYAKEPATMRDRFRDAVWRPQDLNELGLIALPASGPASNGNRPAVRLNIAGSDLALVQQGDRWMDKLDVFLVVRDDSGLHASVRGKRLGLALKPATYQQAIKEGIPVEESLPKIPQGNSVRVIVIDENSQHIGTITLGQGMPAPQ